jgi:hypothetical protein
VSILSNAPKLPVIVLDVTTPLTSLRYVRYFKCPPLGALGSEARTQGGVRDLLVNGLDRAAKVTKIPELSEQIADQGRTSWQCD